MRTFEVVVAEFWKTWMGPNDGPPPASADDLAGAFWKEFATWPEPSDEDWADIFTPWPPQQSSRETPAFRASDHWASHLLEEVLGDCSPEQVGHLLVALLVDADTHNKLQYLGAGPLENLVHDRGDEMIPILNRLLESTAGLRNAFSSVWLSSEASGAVIGWFRKQGFDVSRVDLN